MHLLVKVYAVISGILLFISGILAFEGFETNDSESKSIFEERGKSPTTFSGSHQRSDEQIVKNDIDLGSCILQSKVPCIQSGTCGSVPLLEPARCRRRYCPQTKVYCLDFDGCMIPDPVFIFALAPKEKKCPIPLSLCADKNVCQYVLRKNYDDLREPSVNRLNCSIMTKQIVFQNSTCTTHGDCHWTTKCCPDAGLNRQCVSHDGTVRAAKVLNQANSSCPNCNTSSSLATTSSVPYTVPTTTPTTSLPNENTTKSIVIRITNNYDTVVEGKLQNFQSRMRTQLAEVLNITEQVFTNITARNGSILLDVEMASQDPQMLDKVNMAYKELVSMLKNGSLVLTDFNGTKLDIPPQKNGEIIEEKSYTTIIISVTAASLGTTLLLILWILWNNKGNKAINPLGNHLERLNSHSPFNAKLSVDNLIGDNQGQTGNPTNNHFATFTDPQVQWEIFQKSFNKPGYVWQSSDEAVWAGIDHQVQWPQLLDGIDAPDEESVPIANRNQKKEKESKRF